MSQSVRYRATRCLAAGTTMISAFLAIFLFFNMSVAVAQNAVAASSNASPNAVARIEALTQALVGLQMQAQQTAPRADMAKMASERRDLLAALIGTAPGEVLRLAMPEAVGEGMPDEVRSLIEARREIEGLLSVVRVDTVDPAKSRLLYSLVTPAGEKYSLHFSGKSPALVSGSVVRARGVELSGITVPDFAGLAGSMALNGDNSDLELVAACCNAQSAPSLPPSGLDNTFGEQRTLVLLVNFQDDPTNQPWTPQQADELVFGTVSDFFYENSYQQTWLSGSVFGWYTLPMNSQCDRDQIAAMADQMASDNGVDVASYTRRVYMFPQIACGGAAGLASVGGNPSRAWINGTISLKIVGHEIGHNFGLDHSRGLNCQGGVITADCTFMEYGDGLDIMGSRPAHLNPYQKERLGWLGFGASPAITTVEGSGSFTIEPYVPASQGAKALKILVDQNATTGDRTWMYVDYRQPDGFDGLLNDIFLDTNNLYNGVLFRKVTENDPFGSFLMDMTPDSDPDLWLDMFDTALDQGAGYVHEASGVTITTDAAAPGGATVGVSYGPATCTRANPTVALSPSESQWVAPGTAVDFLVSLTNNDSGACAASTFELASTVPGAWSASFASLVLGLDAGASGSTTVTVTSSPTASDGYYGVSVTGTNAGNPAFAGTGSASYVVSAPTQDMPPVAIDDDANTLEDTPVNIAVLANDMDPDGDPITVIGAAQASKGTVTVNGDGTIGYQPAPGARGKDSFTYQISDGFASAFATVFVKIDRAGGGSGGGKGNGKNR